MKEGKSRSISWLLANINLTLTSLLFLLVIGWLVFSLVMNRMAVAKREFWLLLGLYSILGVILWISTAIGTLLGLIELVYKKLTTKISFYINLTLSLFWASFLIWSFILIYK